MSKAMPEFETKNEAALCIGAGILDGAYKKCRNLNVVGGLIAGIEWHPYKPACKEFSLIKDNRGSQSDYRCPELCALFIDRDKAARQERIAKSANMIWGALKLVVSSPFTWFAKLPAITQVILLILLIVFFSPKLADTIIKIYKAVK